MTAHFLWLGSGTSIRSGWIKLVLWAQTSSLIDMRRSCKCCPHVNKILTHTYNRANSVLFKNTITLKMMHDIFNLHDTEVIICIILVLERMASTILNIRQTTFNPKSNSQYLIPNTICRHLYAIDSILFTRC